MTCSLARFKSFQGIINLLRGEGDVQQDFLIFWGPFEKFVHLFPPACENGGLPLYGSTQFPEMLLPRGQLYRMVLVSEVTRWFTLNLVPCRFPLEVL